jgi:hypothetical protein
VGAWHRIFWRGLLLLMAPQGIQHGGQVEDHGGHGGRKKWRFRSSAYGRFLRGPRRPPCPPVHPERRDNLVGASPTRAMVGWPGSWRAVWLGNWLDRSPATKAASGGRANRRAVMCVKPEQASKGKLWTPTRPEIGEGSTVWRSSRQMQLDRSTGVRGTARRDRGSRKRGRPVTDEGSGLNEAARRRFVRGSDRVVVALKPGNAGGGKGPDFWYVFEADEVG